MHQDLWTSGVFICGHPKSGTSLLMTMLDSHPQLIVYPEESHYFRRYIPNLTEIDGVDPLLVAEGVLLHIFQWRRENPPAHQDGFYDRDYSMLDYDEIQRQFRELVSDCEEIYGSILPAAILSYGIVSGQLSEDTRYWVEKTPYNEEYATQIFALWPNSRCLHILRDPRDNYTSYKQKHPEWESEHFAYSWWKSTAVGIKNELRFGSERYKTMRYEDLVHSPEAAIAEIAGFLDIKDDPALRKPTRAGTSWAGNSMFGDEFQTISTKPSGRYLEELEQSDIDQLNHLLWPELRRFGYLNRMNLVPSEFVVSLWRRLKWLLRSSRLKKDVGSSDLILESS